ncbi:uncharacterized protein LOC120528863 [Polypterus senegalus]|uniref:uncharacterized protein LOC120528863 n=1 Tax=Polypterus senegalus TaxID=55291 RepID=UPI0019666041|nr:uncharacterized protein LOC120528863 [Polypterus senegalus]
MQLESSVFSYWQYVAECSHDSIYDQLWDKSQDIVGEVIKTNFLKEINDNTLIADRYMKLMIQDIYYIQGVFNALNIALKNPNMPDDVKHFLEDRARSYKNFLEMMQENYNLKDANSIIPNKAAQDYVEEYVNIAKRKDEGLYMVIALLPCARLWPYISEKLSITRCSPYYQFKMDNAKDKSRDHYEKILQEYKDKIDMNLGLNIFQTQMKHELAFFQSVDSKN